MEQISAQTQNRIDHANATISSEQVHGQQVAETLAKLLGGRCELQAQQVKPFLDALAEFLGEQCQRLLDAERLLTSENAEDVNARSTRDEKEADALATTAKTKNVLGQVLGQESLRHYGLAGDIPRTGKKLETYLSNVVALLEKKPREVEDNLVGTFKTAVVANRLKQTLDELQQANRGLAVDERETELALVQRNDQVLAWSRAYQGVTGCLEGLYILADQAALADRIRATVRKSAGKDALAADEPLDPQPSVPGAGAETPTGGVPPVAEG